MMNQQNSFIQSVLKQVRFAEAHHEINKELESHISEIRERYADIILDERQLQQQILKRMGNPDEIGQKLDLIHRPMIDWNILIPTSVLLGVGLFVMKELGFFSGQILWVLIGLIFASVFTFLKPIHFLKSSPIGFVSVLLLTFISFYSSIYSGGQPYLSFAGLNIKIIDLSAAVFSIFTPGMLYLTKKRKFAAFFILPALLLPLFVYSRTGSSFPFVLYGLTMLAMVNVFYSNLLPTLSVLVLGFTSLLLWPQAGGQFVSAANFESVREVEAHTDFVLSSIHTISPLISALVMISAIILCFRIFSVSQIVKSQEGKTFCAGVGIFLALATLWSCLASLGYLPLPVAGVNLPFISYGGSMMVAQLSMVGLVLGIYRRKNLSALEWSL
jgi:cell division protein FtsW (lipid II flippase)